MSEIKFDDDKIFIANIVPPQWEHALPELRWVNRGPGIHGAIMVLQQRWRIVTDGKPPRHEWRDVPTVKEG